MMIGRMAQSNVAPRFPVTVKNCVPEGNFARSPSTSIIDEMIGAGKIMVLANILKKLYKCKDKTTIIVGVDIAKVVVENWVRISERTEVTVDAAKNGIALMGDIKHNATWRRTATLNVAGARTDQQYDGTIHHTAGTKIDVFKNDK